MIQTVHLFQIPDLYLQILLCAVERGAAQQFGDIGYIHIMGCQMRSPAVAESVGREL